MKKKFYILISIVLFATSCNYDNQLHEVQLAICINNMTQHNFHIFYENKEYSMSDSIYLESRKWYDSTGNDFTQWSFQNVLKNRDDTLSQSEFVEYISKMNVYYVEKGDTFYVSEKFYDGISCWETKNEAAIDGIMFIRHYWWSHYTATLTDEMFDLYKTGN